MILLESAEHKTPPKPAHTGTRLSAGPGCQLTRAHVGDKALAKTMKKSVCVSTILLTLFLFALLVFCIYCIVLIGCSCFCFLFLFVMLFVVCG
jgi:hypothetical protein